MIDSLPQVSLLIGTSPHCAHDRPSSRHRVGHNPERLSLTREPFSKLRKSVSSSLNIYSLLVEISLWRPLRSELDVRLIGLNQPSHHIPWGDVSLTG